MPEIAVVDTSALIALEKINLLDILCRLYQEIIVPEAVVNEFGTLTIDCRSARKEHILALARQSCEGLSREEVAVIESAKLRSESFFH